MQGNYDVEYVPGTLTITKAKVTVTADDKSKVYGATDPELTWTVEGLKTGDKYVTNGITKLSDGMEIVPITPERYTQKIEEQAKAMTAGDIVGSMKK